MNRGFKKFITGAVLLFTFYFLNDYIRGANGLNRIEKSVTGFFDFLPTGVAGVLGCLVVTAIGLGMIYCFVSGLFRIVTFNQYIPVFEDKTSGGIIIRHHESYPNINRVLSYRESRLAGLSNDDAVELMKSTAILDKLYTGYNVGSETQRVLSYTESKLAGMSSSRALDYLSNKL